MTVNDFDANASFSVATARSHFQTWRRALEAAGLTPGRHSLRYSDEECFENLLRVWTHLRRPPQYLEMKAPPSQITGKAYVGRWKTWMKAIEAFVEQVNQDEAAPAAVTDIAPGEPTDSNQLAGNGDRKIRLGLRYRTIVRDNFKCVLCGNSPATDPSCRLHVDHIHPHSKGSPTGIDNLRTLCEACNVGKGDLMIEPVR